MIQANELRIGNKILYTHPEYESLINTVTVEDIEQCLIDNCGFNKIHAPILLTEEILLKCGFVKSIRMTESWGELWDYSIYGIVTYIKSSTQISYVLKTEDIHKKIISHKYLHQLQNLYFALTKQELKIIL